MCTSLSRLGRKQRVAVQEGPVLRAPRRWGEGGKGLEKTCSEVLSSAVESGE